MPLVHVSGPPVRDTPRPGVVRLLCGVAGAGKTTYAQHLERHGWTRLSVDEEIWRRFGRFGVDYPAAAYQAHTRIAEDALDAELVRLMRVQAPVVTDRSLWQRAQRERYQGMVEDHACQWELVYLSVDEATLRQRLAHRAERVDANAAFAISEGRLATYLAGFQVPRNEGETHLRWQSGPSG